MKGLPVFLLFNSTQLKFCCLIKCGVQCAKKCAIKNFPTGTLCLLRFLVFYVLGVYPIPHCQIYVQYISLPFSAVFMFLSSSDLRVDLRVSNPFHCFNPFHIKFNLLHATRLQLDGNNLSITLALLLCKHSAFSPLSSYLPPLTSAAAPRLLFWAA